MLFVKIPSIGDHQLEVLVVINRRTNVSVVLNEFFESNLTIFVLWMLDRMMQLKSVQKFG